MKRIALWLMLFAVPCAAQTPLGRLDFHLQNAQGQAVSGASVNVYLQPTTLTTLTVSTVQIVHVGITPAYYALVTFTTNVPTFAAGQTYSFSGLTNYTALNGQTLPAWAYAASTTPPFAPAANQALFLFGSANYGPVSDTGTGSAFNASACGSAKGPAAQLYSAAVSGTTLTQPVLTNGFGEAKAYVAQGCYTVVYNSPYTGTLTYADQSAIAASSVTAGVGAGCSSGVCTIPQGGTSAATQADAFTSIVAPGGTITGTVTQGATVKLASIVPYADLGAALAATCLTGLGVDDCDASGILGAQSITSDSFAGYSGSGVVIRMPTGPITCHQSPGQAYCLQPNTPNITILGNGSTVIQQDAPHSFFSIFTLGSGATNAELYGMTLVGADNTDLTTGQHELGIMVNGTNGANIHNMVFKKFNGDGVQVYGQTKYAPPNGVRVKDSTFYGGFRESVTMEGAGIMEVSGNVIRASQNGQIHSEPEVGPGYDFKIHHNTSMPWGDYVLGSVTAVPASTSTGSGATVTVTGLYPNSGATTVATTGTFSSGSTAVTIVSTGYVVGLVTVTGGSGSGAICSITTTSGTPAAPTAMTCSAGIGFIVGDALALTQAGAQGVTGTVSAVSGGLPTAFTFSGAPSGNGMLRAGMWVSTATPGIPASTYISSLSGTSITLSQATTGALSNKQMYFMTGYPTSYTVSGGTGYFGPASANAGYLLISQGSTKGVAAAFTSSGGVPATVTALAIGGASATGSVATANFNWQGLEVSDNTFYLSGGIIAWYSTQVIVHHNFLYDTVGNPAIWSTAPGSVIDGNIIDWPNIAAGGVGIQQQCNSATCTGQRGGAIIAHNKINKALQFGILVTSAPNILFDSNDVTNVQQSSGFSACYGAGAGGSAGDESDTWIGNGCRDTQAVPTTLAAHYITTGSTHQVVTDSLTVGAPTAFTFAGTPSGGNYAAGAVTATVATGVGQNAACTITTVGGSPAAPTAMTCTNGQNFVVGDTLTLVQGGVTGSTATVSTIYSIAQYYASSASHVKPPPAPSASAAGIFTVPYNSAGGLGGVNCQRYFSASGWGAPCIGITSDTGTFLGGMGGFGGNSGSLTYLSFGLSYRSSGLGAVTGVSGGSGFSGDGTIFLTAFNHGCTASTVTVTLAAGVFASAVTTAPGSGCTSAPTSATCTSGTAVCTGSPVSITVTTQLVADPNAMAYYPSTGLLDPTLFSVGGSATHASTTVTTCTGSVAGQLPVTNSSGVVDPTCIPASTGSAVNVNGGSTLATAALTTNSGAGGITFSNSGPTVNATLNNTATTVNGQTCTLGSTCSPFTGMISGFCAGTVTSNQTVQLLGLTSSANCTQTATQPGYPVGVHKFCNLHVRAATASNTAGSGIYTVFKNSSAQALTCTLGTSQNCEDLNQGHCFTTADADVIKGQLQSTTSLNAVTGVSGGGGFSGSGTIFLTAFNNGCTGATATVTLAAGAFSSSATTAAGSGCTALPTSATCTSGTATCTGSPVSITVTATTVAEALANVFVSVEIVQ